MFFYKCNQCGREYKRNEVRYLCPVCGKKYKCGVPLTGVLSVIFDYDGVRNILRKSKRDYNCLSAVEEKYYPPYKVGDTPFFKVPKLEKYTGYKNLWIKNDALNPSGSLKDRASFMIVAEAARIKEKKIITASTGNAGVALSAVCATTDKTALIFLPSSAPKAKLVQMLIYGAKVKKIDGSYDDAFKRSIEYTNNYGGLNRNTAYHPLTIEGKKTAGLEIFFQNGRKVPDVILIPAGDGVIISGIYKAFFDLKMAGIINKLPQLICVQAKSSDAISRFIKTGKYKNAENVNTIADSISVSAPSNAYMARDAVINTNGFAITVSDNEIIKAQFLLASTTGIFAEPASASVMAGLIKIKNKNLIDRKKQIVLLITGNGLKNIEAPLAKLKLTNS